MWASKLLTQSVAVDIGFNYFWDNAYTISTETTESLIGVQKVQKFFSAAYYKVRMMIGVRQTLYDKRTTRYRIMFF